MAARIKGREMCAVQLRAIANVSLIGQKIHTEAIGDYPGGPAEVIDLGHDREAPEIVLNVRHPTYGEIGIFAQEHVILL